MSDDLILLIDCNLIHNLIRNLSSTIVFQGVLIGNKKATKLIVYVALFANRGCFWLMFWLPDQDSNLGPAD